MKTDAVLYSRIQDAPWDEQSREDVLRALRRIDGPRNAIQAEADRLQEQRNAHLILNGQRVGTLVYEIEDQELFLTVVSAEVPGMNALEIFGPQFDALARSRGCNSVRFGTSRPALVDKMRGQGYRVSGVVMRKAL